ncbi:MAG: polysaccharide pyruvyl transferase family protein [Peptococcia bacterium]|jgi:polysaccharide pyruvyl transferase CsaB
MINILIMGYYGLGNVGDEAILAGIIASLEKNIEDVNIYVITNSPIETKELHNVHAVPQSFKKGSRIFFKKQIKEKEYKGIIKAINNCDVFILGGGSLLQDFKVYYLPIFLSLVKLAQSKRKKTVIYGIGAGPIETTLGKYLCNKVLNNTDIVTVRNSSSKKALEKCGVNNVIQTVDPAFALDLPDDDLIIKVLSKQNINNTNGIISTTLHHKLYNDDLYRKTNGANIDIAKRRKIMAEIYDHLIQNYNQDVMFIPTEKNDQKGYLEVRKIMNNKNTIVPDYSSNYKYVLSLLSVSNILIGMRLHSIILATILGVPFIALSYSSKVKSFLELINLDDLYIEIEEIEKPYFKEKLTDLFANVWTNRTYYSKYLLEQSKKLRSIAFDNGKLVADILNQGENTYG